MRLVRLAAPLLLMVALVAPAAAAQTISLSAGPALRMFDPGTRREVNGMNGFAVDAAVGFRVAPRLRLLVGGGLVIARDLGAVYEVFPPGWTPCGCEASEQLYQARVGLVVERGRLLLGAGGVVADAGEGAPTRFGGFGELRVRPFRKVPFDIGLLGSRLSASTGRHRSLFMPTLGLRF